MAEVKDKLITVESAKVIYDTLDNKFNEVVYADEDDVESSTAPLNADTLGGRLASDFALNGFGLGGNNDPIVKRLTSNDDLNTVIENGWYEWADAPQNAPMTYCTMRVWSGLGEYFVQEIITGNIYHDNVVMRRYTKSGIYGWQPWEYENPPMILGEEYLTTERYNGSPVYCKALTFRSSGAISGDFTIPNGISNMNVLVSCFATVNRTDLLPYINGDYMTRVKSVTSGNIDIANNNPYFNQDSVWYFILKYTKN